MLVYGDSVLINKYDSWTLLNKRSVGVAFRNAKKVMKEKYNPYYWAAFVLIE